MTENKNESNIIYFTRLHWVVFFWPGLFLCAAIVLNIYIPQIKQICWILSIFALIWIGMTWATYYFSSITIKKKQVILRTGFWVRQTVDIPLNKIETIDIRQSILGSIMRYGTLIIIGTGGTRYLINYLQAPLTCRRYIEQLIGEGH